MNLERMKDREPRRKKQKQKKPCMVPYEMIDCSVLQLIFNGYCFAH